MSSLGESFMWRYFVISGSSFYKYHLSSFGWNIFPSEMCDRLCFWFLCEYQQLLEISLANHVTVCVVGQSERQLPPLALEINKSQNIACITGICSIHS